MRAFALMSLFIAALAAPAQSAPRPTAALGAIAAPDRYGAAAAAEILRAGGNAVDAAVATAFALAVTYPEAGNLGGGGFMTLYVKGKPYFLDYRETAPAAARAGMYLDAKGEVIPDLSLVGNLAVGVPGTVRGMAEAQRRFGKLSWARDLAPALRLAKRGYVVDAKLVDLRNGEQDHLKPTNFNRYFGALTAGQRVYQPELAAVLQRIIQSGDKGFYEGKTAKLILAQLSRGPVKGILTPADLAEYKAVWREPLVTSWNGYQLVAAPPPSSGGIALTQMLGMKSAAKPLFAGVALNSVQYMHLIAEIEKRVFADRAEYMGDPAFVRVPVDRLIDPAYIRRRAAEIDPAQPSALQQIRPGLEKPQTTHFSVVDRWGNAVSNTYTLNGWFGAGVVVEDAGFLLNDEMDDFSAKPGAPNVYGVVGGDANAIAPGKRPLSSMSPTILIKDGKPAMVIGTPGGSRIFTSVFQVLVDVYDYGLSLKQAVALPRFHHQLLPENTIFFEPYRPATPEQQSALAARGYRTETQDFVGDIEAVRIENGVFDAEADPRARGVALNVYAKR